MENKVFICDKNKKELQIKIPKIRHKLPKSKGSKNRNIWFSRHKIYFTLTLIDQWRDNSSGQFLQQIPCIGKEITLWCDGLYIYQQWNVMWILHLFILPHYIINLITFLVNTNLIFRSYNNVKGNIICDNLL